jgi:hypothetical protein
MPVVVDTTSSLNFVANNMAKLSHINAFARSLCARRILGILVVWGVGHCWHSAVFADEKADREERERKEEQRRLRIGEPPERFEKHLKPIIEAIKQARTVVVYEGLPHQFWEEETLEK